jgi:hypothetical protein
MSDHLGHWSVRRATAGNLASLLPLVSEFCAVDGHDFDERFVRDRGFDVEGSVWMQRPL